MDMKDMQRVMISAGVLAGLLVLAGGAFAGSNDAVQPAELRTYSTLHSIGIEWEVTGDADHDAKCEVRYRKADAEPWRQALDLFRIDYHGWYGDTKADRAYNLLAGSILFLDPGVAYEVQLALSDLDGGKETRTVVIRTRPIPVRPMGGRVLEVVPGFEGGDGSPGNPFQGLAAAQSATGPGDLLRVHGGHYGEFTFDKPGTPEKRLAWVAAGDGEAVLSQATVTAGHLWLEGLVFRRGPNSANGLVAKGSPQNVAVSRCQFSGFHYSILLSNQSQDWYIADNTIVGDKGNVNGSDTSGEGVELNHSSGHSVAFNRISHAADGVSYPQRNCDIYGNDIRDLTDDGIEPDYGYSNVRIWGNRIHCAFNNAVSFQPMYCGPWYILRNEVFSRKGMLKPNVADRFLLANNTFVVQSRYAQTRADLLLKALSRNNLWILIHQWNEQERDYAIWSAGRSGRGGPYSMEYQPRPEWQTDVDYDGFDWDQTPTPFWWELTPGKMTRFKDLASFAQAVGIEPHALHLLKAETFEIQDIPAYAAQLFSEKRLTLKPGCTAIDAGQALPNVCDQFEGRAPDLGAYELGCPTPHYGPRTPLDSAGQ
jgi:hypothetical protein